jgi:hypothetical protein
MRVRFVRQSLLVGSAALMLALPLGGLASSASAVTPAASSITADPNNLMVNTDTVLTGKNFAPRTKVHLTECAKTYWIAPQNPCNTNNTQNVTTNALGRFRTKFKAEVCPGGARVGPTAVRCYIGVVKGTGVDTVALVPSVKIVVTYP